MPKYACDFAEQVGREAARHMIKQGNWAGLGRALLTVGKGFAGFGGKAGNPSTWAKAGPWVAAGGMHGASELMERNLIEPSAQNAAVQDVQQIRAGRPAPPEQAPSWLPYALLGIPAATGAYAIYQHLANKKKREQQRLTLEEDED